MKNLICLCVLLGVAAVTLAQPFGGLMNGNPFGSMMKQAVDGAKQFMTMFPGMGADAGPFGAMMDQFQSMAGQAGGPEKMVQMFQQVMGKMTEQGQQMMQPFMKQMMELQKQGASPDQMMELLNQMKKAAGQ